MHSFLNRLSSSLKTLLEDTSADWKDPFSPDYDRKYAEDCLYHTVGPLTAKPSWSPKKWYPRASGRPAPAGYEAGGPAPRWTKDEIVIAYAGDPSKMWSYGPKSPYQSPLLRLAEKLGQTKKRGGKQEVSDLYQLGLTELTKMMMPGRDQARSAFISWVTPTILGSMKHGVGITSEERSGITTLKAMVNMKNVDDIREAIDKIGEEYRNEGDQQYDKAPGNVYGQHSPAIYTLGTELIAAPESGDKEQLQKLRDEIKERADAAEELGEVIPGATTGAFSAISTPDRTTRLGLTSIDMPMGDEGNTAAETLVGSVSDDIGQSIDQEAVSEILKIGLSTDLVEVYGSSSDFEEFLQAANASSEEVSGTFTADEFRVIIRNLGSLAGDYPGKGNLRKSLEIPRDAAGWWKPGEDPEIDSIPSTGRIWKSQWLRDGMRSMSNEDIAKEFMDEIREFKDLEIPSERASMFGGAQKIGGANISARDMEMYQSYLEGMKGAEIARQFGISKQNVSNRLKKIALALQGAEDVGGKKIDAQYISIQSNNATKKILLISKIYSDEIMGSDLDESLKVKANTILEAYDPIDRKIIAENALKICQILERRMIREYAGPNRFVAPAANLRELYKQSKIRSFAK